MTATSAPHAARDLLEQVAEAARSKEVIAYTMPAFDGPSMFVNLPTDAAGPSYGWIGYWRSADDLGGGGRPSVVVATAPRGGLAAVRRDVQHAHGLPHMRARVVDGVDVVVASSSADGVDAPLQRVDDAEPLIATWFALATQGLGT